MKALLKQGKDCMCGCTCTCMWEASRRAAFSMQMEFTESWDCCYTSPGARNFRHRSPRHIMPGHPQRGLQAPARPEWGKRPRAKPNRECQMTGLPLPQPAPPDLGWIKGPFRPLPFTGWGHRGHPLRLKRYNPTGFCSKQACVWNHNILGSGFTHITFLVLEKEKKERKEGKKELEEWKWEVLSNGNSFSSLVNEVNKWKNKTTLCEGSLEGLAGHNN